MALITVPQALTYSEVRSLGKLIYELFGGGEKVLFERRQVDSADRPYWHIDAGTPAAFTAQSSGWQNGNRTYIATYASRSFQDGLARAEVLRSTLRHALPFYTFDAAWLNPRIEILDEDLSGPNLPAGSYTVSCSFVSAYGEETLASPGFGVTLTGPKRLRVFTPAWPFQAPLVGKARVYVASGSAARRRAAEVLFPAPPAQGWASAVVTAVPDGSAALEPTKSRMYLSFLDVTSFSVSHFESLDRDGDHDVVCSITCSRPLHDDLNDVEGYRAYQDGEVIVNSDEGSPLSLDEVVVAT